jgi:hypothetical protein
VTKTDTATPPATRWRVGRGYTQTSTSLAVYRIIYAATFLFILGPGRYGPGVTSGEVGGTPAGMFHPPLGPGMLLTGWPPTGFITTVELLLTASLFAILIGAFTRTASLTAAVCGLILTTLLYSAGKIDHAILWTVVVPAVMAFTSWGDTYSVDATRPRIQSRNGFRADATRPIMLVALALGIVFGTAAALKICTGWLDPHTSSTLGWVFAQAIQEGRQAGPPPLFSMTPSVVWLVVDYATVLFEAGFLIAAMRRHWLIPYLCVAAGFHFAAAFTGFPPFLEIISVYLLFVRLDTARLRRLEKLTPRTVLICAGIGLVVYCVSALTLGGPLTLARLLVVTGTAPIVLLLWPGLIVAAVIVGWKHTPQDRPGNTIPPWAILIAVVVITAQTVLTLFVSEPYPALTGPRFMGTFDDGRTINIAEQQLWIINNNQQTPVDHASVFDMSQAGAVELGETRFPSPELDVHGELTAHPTLQDQLRNQYHHFSSNHLPHYGGPLTTAEKTWIKTNLAEHGVPCTNCSLEVQWRRLTFDRNNGKLLQSETINKQNYPL